MAVRRTSLSVRRTTRYLTNGNGFLLALFPSSTCNHIELVLSWTCTLSLDRNKLVFFTRGASCHVLDRNNSRSWDVAFLTKMSTNSNNEKKIEMRTWTGEVVPLWQGGSCSPSPIPHPKTKDERAWKWARMTNACTNSPSDQLSEPLVNRCKKKKKFLLRKKISLKFTRRRHFPLIKGNPPWSRRRLGVKVVKIWTVPKLSASYSWNKSGSSCAPPFSVAVVPAAPIKGREIWFSLAYNPFNLFSPLCAVIDSDGNNWRNVFTTSTWSIQGEMNQILFLEIIKWAEDGA